MHGPAKGHHGPVRKRRRIQIGHNGPGHLLVSGRQRLGVLKAGGIIADGKKRRHINPLQTGPGPEQGIPVPYSAFAPCHPGFGHLQDDGFSVADHHGVEEIGHGLGIDRTRPSGNEKRMGIPAKGRPERDSGQIQHHQDIGVIEFVEKTEPDDIKLRQRGAGFQGSQGTPGMRPDNRPCQYPGQKPARRRSGGPD
jgi:hypothetical protein